MTLNEAYAALKKQTGFAADPIYADERAGDIKHSLADISRAQKAFGYSVQVDFEEGLRRTVDWYRSELEPAAAGSGTR